MPLVNSTWPRIVHWCQRRSNFLGLILRLNGDVVAEWILHRTLNPHVMGLGLSAASWLTT